MSVIVKGMKMPKNCLHCDFDDSYGICACRNEAPYVCEYSAKQRPSWCPLEEVPSAQPETHEKRTETHSCDCIERQAAIDEIARWIGYLDDDMIGRIQLGLKRLPSTQPQRTGRWINHVEDGYVECPFCHSATNCDDNISELHFCFSCGARMEESEE